MTDSQPPGNTDKGSLEPIRYVNLYESADKIYTRKVTGFYQRLRRYTVWPLLLGFLLMPWLVIDGRPAMLFDLPSRHFYILWLTFGPQDAFFLAGLLIISAFALFTVTALFGRVWCGFTCPQTVWTLMFIWVEHLCEGDRNQRIKLDKQDWSFNKFLRKGSKHGLWVLIAFATGATFIGYFYPIRELLLGFLPSVSEDGYVTFGIGPQTAFWTLFFTGMTYLNAGWLREQVCIYMCPYARFQSVMYDRDTVAVHYDAARGETRGPRKSGEDYRAQGKGDCVDCSWCVQVCPVDIDIRDGIQYPCINCGLCVDACDTVMDKMNYPKGLIRFTSEDQLETGKTRFLRPRAMGYLAVLLVVMGLFTYLVIDREPVKLSISRDRAAYQIRNGEIQNIYVATVTNLDNREHVYHVTVESDLPITIKGKSSLFVRKGEVAKLPLRLAVSEDDITQERVMITLTVTAEDKPELSASSEVTFLSPGE